MSDLKFQPILDSYEQLGVNVGDTRRNSQVLTIFNAVQANFVLDETMAFQIWGDTMASKH